MTEELTELAENATATGMVKIVHKESGLKSEVQESTVVGWESAGWTRADNGSEAQGQQAQQQLPPPSTQPAAVQPGVKNQE